MSVRYSAGIATAYGAAVRGGYTGTYEQFCADLAALPGVVETLENITASASTLPAGSSVTASYNNGAFAFGIPKGDTGATGATGQTGATGNGIASIEKTGTSGLVDTYTITYTNGNTTTFDVTNGEVTQAEFLTAFPHDSASGSLVTIPDGADSIPVRDCVVSIEPVQSGSGDPAPDNVRPISGWTGCNLYRVGENLFDGSFLQGYYAFADGSVTSSSKWICTDKLPCKPSTVYVAKSDPKDTRYQGFVFFDASGNYISSSSTNNYGKIGYTATSPSNAAYLAFNIAGAPNTTSDIYPSDVKRFVIYDQSTYATYSVSWSDDAGTVYGGTLDVTTGKLTVECEQVTIPASQSPWYSGYGGYYFVNARYSTKNANRAKYAKCNLLNVKSSHSSAALGFYPENDAFYFEGLSNIGVSTLSGWLSWIQTNGLIVLAPLATPVEYTLTPQQVTTLLGLNNLWADCGNVSLDYRADPTLYIQRLTGSAEDDMTANANISNGSYFMVGVNLFVATASIANGDAIVPGTNCTALTLADALNALNA